MFEFWLLASMALLVGVMIAPGPSSRLRVRFGWPAPCFRRGVGFSRARDPRVEVEEDRVPLLFGSKMSGGRD